MGFGFNSNSIWSVLPNNWEINYSENEGLYTIKNEKKELMFQIREVFILDQENLIKELKEQMEICKLLGQYIEEDYIYFNPKRIHNIKI